MTSPAPLLRALGPLALHLALLAGCGAAPVSAGGLDAAVTVVLDASAAPDATTRDPVDAGTSAAPDATVAVGPTIEVGTGGDRFVPLATGDLVELDVGPQGGGRLGGYHIWGGLRARGFDPVGALVRYQIFDAQTGTPHAEQERILALEPASGDTWVAYGMAPRLDDCCMVEIRELVLRVELVDRNGLSGADERHVMSGYCLDGEGARVCI